MLPIDLTGKIAVVTGVSSGIGAGISLMLAKAGCKIAGCGRSAEDSVKAGKFLESIKNEGSEAFYRSVDVTIPEQIEGFIDSVKEEYNGIDILISNAGMNVFKGAEKANNEDWEFNSNLNLRSHWLISRKAKPLLEKGSGGTIIIITSNHAFHTLKGCFPYNVSKAGLLGLVRSLAIEWGPSIRTVGIAPGFILTEGSDTWFNSFENPEEEFKRTIRLHPVGKLGTVEEIGALCAFLSSDFAGFITGTTYLADGGRSAVMQD